MGVGIAPGPATGGTSGADGVAEGSRGRGDSVGNAAGGGCAVESVGDGRAGVALEAGEESPEGVGCASGVAV